MHYEEIQPALFLVRYLLPGDLAPALQDDLVKALRTRCGQGKTAVVFVVGAGVRIVDIGIPTYWLKVTSDLGLSAMAVVTQSLAVRVAALGFAGANRVRGQPLPVETFADEHSALTWATQRIASS